MRNDAPLWSAEQHGWLQALGHTLYVAADAEVDAVVAQPATEARGTAAADAATPERRATVPAPARSAAPATAPPRERAPSPPATTPEPPRAPPARRSGLRLPDRLQIALLRASGRNPNDPATQTLMATWPLAELRGNAAAKRALWPQLRALRKQAPR